MSRLIEPLFILLVAIAFLVSMANDQIGYLKDTEA